MNVPGQAGFKSGISFQKETGYLMIQNRKSGKPENQISLRPFPHPYRAALAICSDIDNCAPETFVRIHQYLNDQDKGLGLPVADSFFAWGREPGHMAYYLPDGLTRSPEADLIRAGLKGGLIDSIHSWGDFWAVPPEPVFLRDLAKRLTDELVSLDLGVKVWINHGDDNNRQNFKSRLQPGYVGDDPDSPYYTADLAEELGVRFYWWSEVVAWPLSCRKRNPVEAILKVHLMNNLKNMAQMFRGKKDRIIGSRQLVDLCLPVTLRNGKKYWAFSRYNQNPKGMWHPPNRLNIHQALSAGVLHRLVEEGGYLIYYTHLGQPHGPGVEFFPEEVQKALEHLAEMYKDGRIWVAPTSRILTFWLIGHRLEWKTSREGETFIIDLTLMDDPTTGPRLPEKEELDGLCFYTTRPDLTVIRLDGRTLETRVYPADHTGMGAVGIDAPPPPDISCLE